MNLWSALFGILLIGWITYGSHWYTCRYWNLCAPSVTEEPSSNSGDKPDEEATPTPSPEQAENEGQEPVSNESSDSTAPSENEEEALSTEEMETIQERTFLFPYNSARINLSAEDKDYFLLLAAYLKGHPEAKVRLVGHTDNVGEADRNHKLAEERAQFVQDQLTQQGASANSIQVVSEGMNNPVADNNDEAGRQQNRRVEIILDE